MDRISHEESQVAVNDLMPTRRGLIQYSKEETTKVRVLKQTHQKYTDEKITIKCPQYVCTMSVTQVLITNV